MPGIERELSELLTSVDETVLAVASLKVVTDEQPARCVSAILNKHQVRGRAAPWGLRLLLT